MWISTVSPISTLTLLLLSPGNLIVNYPQHTASVGKNKLCIGDFKVGIKSGIVLEEFRSRLESEIELRMMGEIRKEGAESFEVLTKVLRYEGATI